MKLTPNQKNLLLVLMVFIIGCIALSYLSEVNAKEDVTLSLLASDYCKRAMDGEVLIDGENVGCVMQDQKSVLAFGLVGKSMDDKQACMDRAIKYNKITNLLPYCALLALNQNELDMALAEKNKITDHDIGFMVFYPQKIITPGIEL